MPKNWVYVLQCLEYRFYVGTTRRLFRRLKEHVSGTGPEFTRKYKPVKLLALYKFDDRDEFDKREDLEFYIALHFMNIKSDRQVCSNSKAYNEQLMFIKSNPLESKLNENIIKRPNCNCNLPCEIRFYNNESYFVCPNKNFVVSWPEVWGELLDKLYELELTYDTHCDFYRKHKDFKPYNPTYKCDLCNKFVNSKKYKGYNKCFECYDKDKNKISKFLHPKR